MYVLKLKSCAVVLSLKLETGTFQLVDTGRLETLLGLGTIAIDFFTRNAMHLGIVTGFWALKVKNDCR